MANWDDVRSIVAELPETEEHPGRDGALQWQVRGKTFAWERPLRPADLRALGDAAPDGAVLAAYVEHEEAKRVLVAAEPHVYFTTPHFDGYRMVLARLEQIPLDELEELLIEAWLIRAPRRLAATYAADHDLG